ncbi:hypothetical protein [Streptomyces chumphonensis]|uniref:hypothetical protein n=1 Tax=Streptomyces chumphonensis TaxID=1214925 RepID=UPI00363F5AD9
MGDGAGFGGFLAAVLFTAFRAGGFFPVARLAGLAGGFAADFLAGALAAAARLPDVREAMMARLPPRGG